MVNSVFDYMTATLFPENEQVCFEETPAFMKWPHSGQRTQLIDINSDLRGLDEPVTEYDLPITNKFTDTSIDFPLCTHAALHPIATRLGDNPKTSVVENSRIELKILPANYDSSDLVITNNFGLSSRERV